MIVGREVEWMVIVNATQRNGIALHCNALFETHYLPRQEGREVNTCS